MYKFKKEERLCNKKFLTDLFHSDSSFILYPFRIVWTTEKLCVPTQVVVTVSKRNFKKSVDRNLLKRRIREIYRLHKIDHLYSFLNREPILLGIIYIGKEILEYNILRKNMLASFEKLKKYYLVES